MRLLTICGSLQARSANRALLEAAVTLAPPGVGVVAYHGLAALPHFNPDLEADGAPAEVLRLREALVGADAVLIASPEYGHSLPGALKNGIDWVIGSGELEEKVVGITASVPHAARGRRGLAALAGTLGAVRARIVGGEPIVRGAGEAESLRVLLDAVVEAVAALRASDT